MQYHHQNRLPQSAIEALQQLQYRLSQELGKCKLYPMPSYTEVKELKKHLQTRHEPEEPIKPKKRPRKAVVKKGVCVRCIKPIAYMEDWTGPLDRVCFDCLSQDERLQKYGA